MLLLAGTAWLFSRADMADVVDTLLTGLTEGNHDLAVRIAALPDQVRGYEEIKLATVRSYHENLTELLADWAASSSPTMAR